MSGDGAGPVLRGHPRTSLRPGGCRPRARSAVNGAQRGRALQSNRSASSRSLTAVLLGNGRRWAAARLSCGKVNTAQCRRRRALVLPAVCSRLASSEPAAPPLLGFGMAALPAEPFAFHNVHQRSLLRWQGLFAAVSTAAGCPVRVLEPWGGAGSAPASSLWPFLLISLITF